MQILHLRQGKIGEIRVSTYQVYTLYELQQKPTGLQIKNRKKQPAHQKEKKDNAAKYARECAREYEIKNKK